MLGHKTSLSQFKKHEIMSSIFSDHSAMKLKINHMKNTDKQDMEAKLHVIKQWMGQQQDQERNPKIPWSR